MSSVHRIVVLFGHICILLLNCDRKADAQIYRLECRRDALMKVAERDKKLSGVISEMRVTDLRICAQGCIRNYSCYSINYKQFTITEQGNNCELLNVTKTTNGTTLIAAPGWRHYEPSVQVSPRCRNVICNPGYECVDRCATLSGYECIDINECASNPCQNGAVCSNEINRYTCICVPGFVSTNCETDVDECVSSPCQNSATCNNLINKYNCTCVPGYEGINCEKETNECDSNPCQNGATCTDLFNKYKCTCIPGYEGTNCQIDINECASNPCRNSGTCNDQVNKYQCTCTQEYFGINCEIVNVALRKSTAQSSDYYGYDSSRAVDGNKDSIHDHGYCTHTNGDTGAWWRVDLAAQYIIGTVKITNRQACWDRLSNFDVKVGVSTSSYSLCYYHSGTVASSATVSLKCTSDISGRYVLVALRGTNFLQLCEVQVFPNGIECYSNPCQNGGFCINQVNRYICTCAPGYTGTHCETDINECASSPCRNSGTCNDQVNKYQCTCTQEYFGIHCEIVNVARGKSCTQSTDFSTHYASRAVDGNKDTVLDNGGCSHTLENPIPWWRVDLGAQYMIGTVKITNRYLAWDRLSNFDVKVGVSTSSYSLCYYHPGTVAQSATVSLKCNSDVSGRYVQIALRTTMPLQLCEVQVFPNGIECYSNPCQNGGFCINQVNRYTCTCAPGYTGTHCETDINECASNPCRNSGTCYNQLNKYQCTCTQEYFGTNCEIVNVARGKPTAQSSTHASYYASKAVDGNKNTVINNGYCTHTLDISVPWWRVDFGAQYIIGTVKITNRQACWDRLSNFDVKVGASTSSYSLCYYHSGTVASSATVSLKCNSDVSGRYLQIELRRTVPLTLCEVQVFPNGIECYSNPCQNGGLCINEVNRYICTCATGYEGANCEYAITSCRQKRLATGTTTNGVYELWDSSLSSKYSAYCHMSDGGWTLVARFSNADTKNWAEPSGAYWYDKTAVGSTTSPSANSDMISKAFYNAKGTDIKLTRSDSSSHAYLLYSNGCMSTTTFRSKITSYGNFRNNGLWSRDRCLGSCYVNSYQYVSGVSGFSQYNCNSNIQSANYIGFWCHYSSGDGAVIMIGGGGSSCARADHGIAITEENDPRIGTTGTKDFGDDMAGTTSYALNLWVR